MDRRARVAREQFPSGAWFTVRLADGSLSAFFFEDAGDPRPDTDPREALRGSTLEGGPHASMKIAISRSQGEKLYRHILREAFATGIMRSDRGHVDVTKAMVSDWTGFSVPTIRSWLRPATQTSRRKLERHAIRLIIHEFRAHDQSKYPWDYILNQLLR